MLTFKKSAYRCNQTRQKWKQKNNENEAQDHVSVRWVEVGWTGELHVNYIKNLLLFGWWA